VSVVVIESYSFHRVLFFFLMETLDDIEAICVVYSLYKRQKLKQKITKRKYLVHPLNMKRINEGQFQVNFLTLRSHPDEFFKYY